MVLTGDSQLVVRQMTGEYRVAGERLLPLFREAKQLQERCSSFEIKHVYRCEHRGSRHGVESIGALWGLRRWGVGSYAWAATVWLLECAYLCGELAEHPPTVSPRTH